MLWKPHMSHLSGRMESPLPWAPFQPGSMPSQARGKDLVCPDPWESPSLGSHTSYPVTVGSVRWGNGTAAAP